VATVAGALLSGPIALSLVEATHPQPEWRDAATFATHFHPVQTTPFYLGLVLVSGCVVLVVSLAELASEEQRLRSRLAVCASAVFAALVLLNYVVQTSFVPNLVRAGAPALPLLLAFSMANPESLAWCLELWAYAILGVATWLVAPVFGRGSIESAARIAFIANGPVSLIAVPVTAFAPRWMLTTPGLVAFAAWNGLVVAMAILAYLALGRRAPPDARGLSAAEPSARAPART
jgi:hypothetical protein